MFNPDLVCRLVQYPLVPCKGRITISREDLACLDAGEFLNDVIIDFYLKSVAGCVCVVVGRACGRVFNSVTLQVSPPGGR